VFLLWIIVNIYIFILCCLFSELFGHYVLMKDPVVIVCVGSGHGCGDSLFPVIVELPIEQMAVDANERLPLVLKWGRG